MVHNETVNVWTHLVGAVVAGGMVVVVRWVVVGGGAPVWPLLVHIGTTTVGLSLSSTFHLLGCTSCADFKFFQKLDYVGILTIASGVIISPLYYGFICSEHEFWRRLWIITAIIGCGVAALLTMCQDRPEPWINGVAWFCAGLMGCPGFIHLIFFKQTGPVFLWVPWAIGLSLVTMGVGIYAMKVPERIWPKRFDYFGSSH